MIPFNASIKEKLWHQMRSDLARYIPEVSHSDLLMCCACGRFLPQDHFSLEHILPQQALRDDPVEVRRTVTTNARSGNVLLCSKPLRLKGNAFNGNGCNGFKGKFYDGFLRQTLNRSIMPPGGMRFNGRHHIALVSAAYLALVMRYGYQVALTQAGLIIRQQFFNMNRFIKTYPIRFQMVLMGEKPGSELVEGYDPWRNPFWFHVEEDCCLVGFRGLALHLPLSRNPEMPISMHLPLKPARYAFRPNFSTAFH
jgi:hypothetical protein